MDGYHESLAARLLSSRSARRSAPSIIHRRRRSGPGVRAEAMTRSARRLYVPMRSRCAIAGEAVIARRAAVFPQRHAAVGSKPSGDSDSEKSGARQAKGGGDAAMRFEPLSAAYSSSARISCCMRTGP